MNTRRSFLKTLAATVVAAAFVCRIKTEAVEVPLPEKPRTMQVNPEWEDAPYECLFAYNAGAFKEFPEDYLGKFAADAERYTWDGKAFVQVPKYAHA